MSPTAVAFDTGPLHGPRTGIGFAVQALCAALSEREDVSLQPYVLSFRAALEPGTTRLPLPASVAQRLWAHTGHPRVDRWLRGAQVVHGTNYVVPPTALPTVVSVYDCWFLTHPDQANPHVRRAGAVLRAAIARGAVVHTSSRSTEATVRALFPGAAVQTVHLGPLPLPAPSAAPPIPDLEGRPYVVAIGTLERRKNLPTLVRAFGVLADQHPDLALVLAGGDGDDVAAIAAAIDQLGDGRSQRVLRTGRIDEGSRSWLLRHAGALAYPSLDEGFGFPLLDAMQADTPVVASTAGSIPEVAGDAALVCDPLVDEGFGFPLLDAMQADTPVVASTAGSIPEVAGDAALLCDPLDHEALAAHLHTVLTDHGERDRLVELGRGRWPEFEWQRCADEMVHLYGRVMRGDTDDLR